MVCTYGDDDCVCVRVEADCDVWQWGGGDEGFGARTQLLFQSFSVHCISQRKQETGQVEFTQVFTCTDL